jgi:hypothetical protein
MQQALFCPLNVIYKVSFILLNHWPKGVYWYYLILDLENYFR